MAVAALNKLVAGLLLAIHAISGYAAPADAPEVELIPPATLQLQACGRPCTVYGWFPPGNTIYLDDRLDPVGDVRARGILVHELVHYLQQENGRSAGATSCESWIEREREAFDVQIRWLTEQSAPLTAISPGGKIPLRFACQDQGPPPSGSAHGENPTG